MVVGLRPDSRFIGGSVAEAAEELAKDDTSILAILRGEHMVGPRPELIIDRADHLILVVGERSQHSFEKHLHRW